MTDEQGAPEGLYSVEMLRGSVTPTCEEDRTADRLWLAGMAMQALVGAGSHNVWDIARQAYAMADAMLEVEGEK
jgi:hypothetical protein